MGLGKKSKSSLRQTSVLGQLHLVFIAKIELLNIAQVCSYV